MKNDKTCNILNIVEANQSILKISDQVYVK